MLSKYVITTDSFNGDFGLLYNKKTGYFVRYDKNIFTSLDSLINNEQVNKFLLEKQFLNDDFELEEIENYKQKYLKSEEKAQLIIKVTKDCNFRCIYCYENFHKKNMNFTDADKIIFYVENILKKGKIKRLIISWFGGEPLLNLEVIKYISPKVIKICDDYNVEYIGSIVTNGYLLSKENLLTLINCGVISYQVTIDGCMKTHDLSRPTEDKNPTFKKIVDNLNEISNSNYQIAVVLRVNISKKVYNSWSEVKYELFDQFKSDQRFYISLHSVVDYDKNTSEVSDEKIVELMKDLVTNGYNIVDLRTNLSPKNAFCHAAQDNSFVIDYDCKISKCSVTNDNFSFVGEINSNGELVYNNNIQIWRNVVNTKCPTCTNYANCFGGQCPLETIKQRRKSCKQYRLSEKFLVQLLHEQSKYNITIGGKNG